MPTHVVEANGARIPAVGLGTWDLRGRVCARIFPEGGGRAGRVSVRNSDCVVCQEQNFGSTALNSRSPRRP
jgi:hypothetical protein